MVYFKNIKIKQNQLIKLNFKENSLITQLNQPKTYIWMEKWL